MESTPIAASAPPNDTPSTWPAISLRDYFAAKCLEGFWASEETDPIVDGDLDKHMKKLCRLFYRWSDAMLAARKAGAE